MKPLFFLGVLCAGIANLPAVEMNGGFDTTAPTSSGIANWDTGWNPSDPTATTAYTGWDYVGNMNGASGVYLGNGWVLTADHVGNGSALGVPDATPFVMTVEGVTTTYYNTGVYDTFTNPPGTGEQNPVDLELFQISSPTAPLPALPSLSLATSAPPDYLNSGTGATIGMIGYGGGLRSWGVDTITLSNQYTPVPAVENGPPQWFSTDFYTSDGPFTKPGASAQDNNSQLVSGDSGGGDFIFNGTTWTLAGINEASGTTYVKKINGTWEQVAMGTPGALELDLSAYVQLSDYASQINLDTAPEPPAWVLLAGTLALLGTVHVLRPRLSL